MNLNYKILGYGLLSLIIISILIFTIFFLLRNYSIHKNNILSELECYCISIILSILILTLIGIIESISPIELKRIESTIFLFINLYILIKIRIKNLVTNKLLIVIIIQYLFCILLVLISSLNYEFKYQLIDGPYVSKESVISTRIQYLTGDLPADNTVSYVVQEYLAKNISFKENDPILPGQSVTNRPILLSLTTLPIRTLLRPIGEAHTTLPKFNYLGIDWPDFRIFTRDESTYSVFLSLSIFFNSFLFVACALFAIEVYKFSNRMLIIFGLLYCSSAYIIMQTIFAWPKSVAGSFIILSLYSSLVMKRFFISGFIIGMAYLFHPYTLSYILCSYFLYLIKKGNLRDFKQYTFGIFIATIPWLVWSKFYLDIPSDLIEQNLRMIGPLADAILIRLNNLNALLIPSHLNNISVNFINLYPKTSFNLTGAIGAFVFFGVWLTGLTKSEKKYSLSTDEFKYSSENLILIFLVTSCILITMIFSYPALPIVHGFQPLIAFILMLSVSQMSKSTSNKIIFLVYIQIFCNLIFLFLYLLSIINRL
jgi:hypothetical protein